MSVALTPAAIAPRLSKLGPSPISLKPVFTAVDLKVCARSQNYSAGLGLAAYACVPSAIFRPARSRIPPAR